MEYKEPTRARRRRLTVKIARRRRYEHLRVVHPDFLIDPSPENVDCICETSRTYYAKRTSMGCGCRKRRRFRAKVGMGMCHYEFRLSVAMRILSRRLCRAIQAGRVDPEWVESGRGFYGEVEKRRLPRR